MFNLMEKFQMFPLFRLFFPGKTVYSAEIATPKLRGRLTVLTSMSIACGILMIYILGYMFPVCA